MQLELNYTKGVESFYQDFSDYCIDMLLSPGYDCLHVPSFFLKSLFCIVKKEVRLDCTAGVKSVFYVKSGDVYPCQMYYGDTSFSLGNVNDISGLGRGIESYEQVSRFDVSECQRCFARGFCVAWCSGGALMFCGDQRGVSPIRCLMQKAIGERIICRLVKIFGSDLTLRFVQNIRRVAEKYSRSKLFNE